MFKFEVELICGCFDFYFLIGNEQQDELFIASLFIWRSFRELRLRAFLRVAKLGGLARAVLVSD